jgi:type II secretory pathway pseudopilin PulG
MYQIGNERGITIVELLIGALIAAIVALATFEFYQAQHQLYIAQADIVERQGNLRFALDDLKRQVRRTGYRVMGGTVMRVSPTFDTLEIYLGNDVDLNVDTLRYYVNRFDSPPSLIKQLNQTTPYVFAQGIDSAFFVPAGGTPPERLAVSLVSVEQGQYENSALTTRRRVGETINLRNQ